MKVSRFFIILHRYNLLYLKKSRVELIFNLKCILKIYKTFYKFLRYKVLYDSGPNSSVYYIETILIKSIRKWVNNSTSTFYKNGWLSFKIYKRFIKLLIFIYIRYVLFNIIFKSLGFKKWRLKIPMFYKWNKRLGFFKKSLILFFRSIRWIYSF